MNDLIGKNQSLIEWKEDFKGFVEGLDIPRDDYKGIMSYIDEVPPAEPEWKKGKWILDGHHIKCNRCENIMCSRDREGDLIPRNFCPNCGSYNGGEEDDSISD